MSYPEKQDWQRECRVCGKQKCPKPEEVAKWLREVIQRTHEKQLWPMASERPGVADWRWQAAHFEAVLDIHLTTTAFALEGVCPDCIEKVAPKEAERLDSPEGLHAWASFRWKWAVPLKQENVERARLREEVLAEVASFNAAGTAIAEALRPPAEVMVDGPDGRHSAKCAWARGGLAVTMVAESTLDDARARRKAGNRNAYPCEVWTVTHAASGRKLPRTYETPDEAIGWATKVVGLIDWTQPLEACAKAIQETPEALAQMRMLTTLEQIDLEGG